MNKRIAFLFAGQGSQYIGMAKDIYEKYDYVKEMFREANEILGYRLEDLIFIENNLLNQTLYTQTAILVVTCCIYEVLKRELNLKPTVVSGFSLGEYSALYSAGIYSFKEIVNLVFHRATLMEIEATKNAGAMAAIIGLDKEILEEICNRYGDVWIANYNTPSQLVISGLKSKMDKVVNEIIDIHKKKVIYLNVNGAFHSKFMKDAAINLKPFLLQFNPKKPLYPILMNYNAKELEIDDVVLALVNQIYSPVYFFDIIFKMINEYEIEEFIEIGPGKVLSGFVRKIDRNKSIFNFEKLEDLNLYKESEQ